ncbi:MAG: hypothetical protein V1917_01630 [Candidatus Gottesmanbacteria bacterium]
MYTVRHADTASFSRKKILPFLIMGVVLLIFSYPALSYDLFNYMTTAKVAYTHHENPYLVMPIEITNEPYLAFTRAANKVALYGPVWILITAIPHVIGSSTIWGSIIAFKLLNALMYVVFAFLIYRMTKSWKNVLFFVLNPLILIEVLISGHNDIYMMVFAVLGIFLWERKGVGNKIGAALSFVASFLIKGATLVLLPLLLVKKLSQERLILWAYWLLAFVFFAFAPLREELYPWYAVWLVGIASLLDMKKYSILIWFTVVLTFALELRHLPYMLMGYYEGPGPMLRSVCTIVPIGMYILYVVRKNVLKKTK